MNSVSKKHPIHRTGLTSKIWTSSLNSKLKSGLESTDLTRLHFPSSLVAPTYSRIIGCELRSKPKVWEVNRHARKATSQSSFCFHFPVACDVVKAANSKGCQDPTVTPKRAEQSFVSINRKTEPGREVHLTEPDEQACPTSSRWQPQPVTWVQWGRGFLDWDLMTAFEPCLLGSSVPKTVYASKSSQVLPVFVLARAWNDGSLCLLESQINANTMSHKRIRGQLLCLISQAHF